MPFGEWLTQQMNKAGLNDTMLSSRMRVRHSTIGRWRRNERVMSGKYAQPLADALGIHVDEVLAAQNVRKLDRRPETYEIFRIADRVSADAQRIRKLHDQVRGDRKEEVSIPLIGRVPADSVRWTAVGEGKRTVDVPASWLRGARHLFAVEVSGECLSSLKIHDGDIIICDDREGEEPPEGKVTLVRIGDERTFKAWYRVNETEVELRDGTGKVVYRLTERDDFEVIGIAVHRHGDFD